MFERCLGDVFVVKRPFGIAVGALVLRRMCLSWAWAGWSVSHGRRVFRKTHFGEGGLTDLVNGVAAMSPKGGDSGLFWAVLGDV